MSLLMAMAGARRGGAEKFFVTLARAFREAGVPVRAAIRGWPERLAALEAAGVPAAGLPFRGRLDPLTPWLLERALQGSGADTLLTFMNRASAAAPRGRAIHVGRLGNPYNLKYYRRCDALVAITPPLAEHARAGGWPAERVRVIPNFHVPRPAPAVDRARHDTPNDVPLVLGLGRLHPSKGFDVLIRALAQLPRAWLWLVGEGPMEAALRRAAAEAGIAGRIRFLGWREDVEAVLGAADVMAMPSRHEGLGTVILEAWAAGRPVVAARSLGPAALIEHGRTGLLVPVDDADALAAALHSVLGSPDLTEVLRSGGLEQLQGHYTQERVITQYQSFFEDMGRLGKRR